MSEDNTATGARTGRNRKPKSPPDLDLSASEVREIPAEAAADASTAREPAAPEATLAESATTTPETPAPETAATEPPATEPAPAEPVAAEPPVAPPPAPSKLLPAAIGLVAGLVGGLGGSFLAPKVSAPLGLMQAAAPVVPPALTERLAKAEAALGDAKTREDALRAEIAALGTKLAGESEAARKAVETLDAKAARLGQPNPDIDMLKGRLGSLEGESKLLPKELGALGTKVGTLQPKLDTLEKTVEVLSGRLAAVGSKDALALANGRLAAQSLLEDDFAAGKPYAAALDLLTRTGGEASLIALVKPFAENGAPRPATLAAEFAALKPKAAAASTGDTGLMDRAKKAALSLVEIRHTGSAAGTDDSAILARAEQALARGDLSAALAASGQLSPGLTPSYAPWRARLEARIKAGEAVVLLRKDAQSALARAAASAK